MGEMKRCPICGEKNPAGTDQCGNCGTSGLTMIFLTKQSYEEWRQKKRENYQERKQTDAAKISANTAGTQHAQKNVWAAQKGNQAKNRTKSQTQNMGGLKRTSVPARQTKRKTKADWENIFRQWDAEYDEASKEFDEATEYEYRDWYPSCYEPTRSVPHFMYYKHWIGEKIERELKQAKTDDDCESFCILSEKLAEVLHGSGEDSNAHEVEHTAFLFRQEHICRKTNIPLSCFGGKTPCLEYLKNALTREADLALEKKEFAEYYLYKMINARICRAQGQEDNAFLLERSAASYKSAMDKALRKRRFSQCDMEKELIYHVAKKYNDSLYA